MTGRVDAPLRECVAPPHWPYGNREGRWNSTTVCNSLRDGTRLALPAHRGSKRFFTFGALPPDWLSAPRCDSTGCSGVFF